MREIRCGICGEIIIEGSMYCFFNQRAKGSIVRRVLLPECRRVGVSGQRIAVCLCSQRGTELCACIGKKQGG